MTGFQHLCKGLRERFTGVCIQIAAVASGFNNLIRSGLFSTNKSKPNDLYVALFKNIFNRFLYPNKPEK